MTPGSVSPGFEIPPFQISSVDPQRMKTMTAILRDPYPIHWDRDAVAAMGLGHRTINQGAINLGYIANMLMSWAGDGAIRRLTASFDARALDGDSVTARGIVESLVEHDEGWRAHCRVWLERGDQRLVSGTAEVSLPPDALGSA